MVMRMTTNAAIVHLDELQLGTKGYDYYIEHIKQHFITNNVPEAKVAGRISMGYWSKSIAIKSYAIW